MESGRVNGMEHEDGNSSDFGPRVMICGFTFNVEGRKQR